MTLLLMAAGSGTRYGEELTRLKQFALVGPRDEFLLEFSIYDAIQFGFDHIVVVIKAINRHFLYDYLCERLPRHVKLDIVIQDINDLPNNISIDTDTSERMKPWGTAHAVWCARDVIDSDFIIINADDYYGKQAFKAAANFIKNNIANATYALVGYSLKDTLSENGSVSRGLCNIEGKQLITIEELTKIETVNGKIIDVDSGRTLAPETMVSMNFWICNTSIFNYIETYFTKFLQTPLNLKNKKEIYLPFVAQEIMTNGLITINVIPSHSTWFGLTYYEDKTNAVSRLKDLTKKKQYPKPLWQ